VLAVLLCEFAVAFQGVCPAQLPISVGFYYTVQGFVLHFVCEEDDFMLYSERFFVFVAHGLQVF